jgi:hypothetical protein
MRTIVAVIAMAAAAVAQDGGKAEAVRKLDSLRISVDFQDAKLDEALSYIRDVTGLNLVLLPKAAEHAGDAPVRLKVKDLTVKSVLKLMLGSRDLAATWKDNAIIILPQADLQSSVTLQMYDIRAQLMELKDFPGPRMELVSPNATSPGMTGITVTMIDDPKPPLIPEDVLVQLIKENTGGRSWDNDKTAISVANGMLVVSQSPSVHREIQRLLGLLGQYR